MSQEVEGVPDAVLHVVQQVGLHRVAVLSLDGVLTLHFRFGSMLPESNKKKQLIRSNTSNENGGKTKLEIASFKTEADVDVDVDADVASK